MTMNRTLPATALLALALSGCAAPHPGRAVAAPPCPARRSPVRDSGGFRGMFTLVPGTPVVASSCAYAGMNDRRHDYGRLIRGHALRGRIVRALQGELNREGRWPGGTYDCPADDGAAHLLLFRYADGGVTRVSVGDGGCRSATNGQRTVRAPGDYPGRYGG